jgi:TonB family protein
MKRVIIVIAAATLLVAASHAQQTSATQESIGKLPAVVPPDFIPSFEQPVPIKTAFPVYPEEAKRDSVEGTVWLKVLVDSMGTPVYAKVAKLKQSVPVRNFFDRPTLDAVMKFRFRPAMEKGRPVACWVVIPFRFTLKK